MPYSDPVNNDTDIVIDKSGYMVVVFKILYVVYIKRKWAMLKNDYDYNYDR